MDLTRIEAPDFDLAMTLNSGQVFHWEKIGDGFCGMIGDRAVYVEQRGDILKVRFGETRALPKLVARYFALDHPLEEICASFPRDPVMDAVRRRSDRDPRPAAADRPRRRETDPGGAASAGDQGGPPLERHRRPA